MMMKNNKNKRRESLLVREKIGAECMNLKSINKIVTPNKFKFLIDKLQEDKP